MAGTVTDQNSLMFKERNLMRLKLFVTGIALLAAGCESGTTTQTQPATSGAVSRSNSDVTPSSSAVPVAGTPAAADNTAINDRDRHPAAKTPLDQNENSSDIQITADIRKQVVKQDGLSVDAHNVKIITADGKVTLRGPVKTQQEREAIEKIALQVAGNDHVDNQLEVAP